MILCLLVLDEYYSYMLDITLTVGCCKQSKNQDEIHLFGASKQIRLHFIPYSLNNNAS